MPDEAHEISVPLADVRGAERKRRSGSRWPLPVALVLAIVYWFYLNSQVFRTESVELGVRIVQSTDSLTAHGFDIRLPQKDLLVTRIDLGSDATNFDLASQKLRFTVRASGASLKQLQTSTAFVADIPDRAVEECRSNGFAVCSLRLADVKDANGELTPHLKAMQPSTIRLHLGRSSTDTLNLSWDLVTIRYPEGIADSSENWDRRIFQKEIRFEPDSVDLEGPEKWIRSTADRKGVFVLDLTEKLTKLTGRSQNERLDVTEFLSIDKALADKGVRCLQLVKATVQFTPASKSFAGLEIPIEIDWKGSPLAPTEFRIDPTVKFELRSYDPELSSMLRDDARGRRWIDHNLRCFVRPAELDPAIDTSKEDFVAHLSPHFFLYDDNFALGRELKIQQKSLISISRKSP